MANQPASALLIKSASALHTLIYRLTRGRIGGRLGRLDILLLTTTGRKSGKPRTTPLVFLRDGNDLVIVASYGGHDQQPAWFLNLESEPQVQIRIDGAARTVSARKATVEERTRLWPEVLHTWPGYAKYQERTRRTIPLVILTAVTST